MSGNNCVTPGELRDGIRLVEAARERDAEGGAGAQHGQPYPHHSQTERFDRAEPTADSLEMAAE